MMGIILKVNEEVRGWRCDVLDEWEVWRFCIMLREWLFNRCGRRLFVARCSLMVHYPSPATR